MSEFSEQDERKETTSSASPIVERCVMFFLYKEGVYGHGVFWIGNNIEEGKAEADKAANLDKDDYHDWQLFRFIPPEEDDYKTNQQHELIYTGART